MAGKWGKAAGSGVECCKVMLCEITSSLVGFIPISSGTADVTAHRETTNTCCYVSWLRLNQPLWRLTAHEMTRRDRPYSHTYGEIMELSSFIPVMLWIQNRLNLHVLIRDMRNNLLPTPIRRGRFNHWISVQSSGATGPASGPALGPFRRRKK